MILINAIIQATVYANLQISEQTPSGWAVESVQRARDMNLMPVHGGYQQATTRAEFSAFAVRLYQHQNGAITGYNRNRFTDTNDSYVARAAHIGLVNGVTDTTFAPHRAITRQEAAVLLHRVALALGDTTAVRPATFGDTGSVPSWARDGINWASSTYPVVMGGVGGDRFNPTGAYTTEQTAVSLVRVYDVVNGNGNNGGNVSQQTPIPTPTNTPVPPTNPPAGNEWGEVVVLGQTYSLSGGANATLSFAQRHGNDWFIWSRGHASNIHRNNNISIDGAHKYVDGVHVATAFANTDMGVVSVATPAGVANLNLEGQPRARAI